MIVTVNPVNFEEEEIASIDVSTVEFKEDCLEHIAKYMVRKSDKMGIMQHEYRDFHYIVKRSTLLGMMTIYEHLYDKWKVSIYTSAWRDLELWFDIEKEARSFAAKARSYIFIS